MQHRGYIDVSDMYSRVYDGDKFNFYGPILTLKRYQHPWTIIRIRSPKYHCHQHHCSQHKLCCKRLPIKKSLPFMPVPMTTRLVQPVWSFLSLTVTWVVNFPANLAYVAIKPSVVCPNRLLAHIRPHGCISFDESFNFIRQLFEKRNFLFIHVVSFMTCANRAMPQLFRFLFGIQNVSVIVTSIL